MTSPGEATSRPVLATRDRLVAAALDAFSRTGYEGTTVRQIERLAGVERGLIGYHFGSKQEIWNVSVDDLFERYTVELEALQNSLRDVSRRERVRALLMAYARFNARNPQFFRILIIECQSTSERSDRLAVHLRRAMDVFSDLAHFNSAIPVDSAILVFEIIGAAGSVFSLSAHSELTFGDRLSDPDFVDRFAMSLASIALGDTPLFDDHDPAASADGVHFLGL